MISKQTSMHIIFTLRTLIVTLALLGVCTPIVQPTAMAQKPADENSGSGAGSISPDSGATGSCGGVDTSIIKCSEPGGENASIEQSGIWGVVKLGIQIMTAGVGVLAVGGILWGSVLYASAGGMSDQTKRAKDIIKNTVIGLLLYVFMFAIINFLVPGGVLS